MSAQPWSLEVLDGERDPAVKIKPDMTRVRAFVGRYCARRNSRAFDQTQQPSIWRGTPPSHAPKKIVPPGFTSAFENGCTLLRPMNSGRNSDH